MLLGCDVYWGCLAPFQQQPTWLRQGASKDVLLLCVVCSGVMCVGDV